MESHKSDWERVSSTKLGEGGQSEVYLVRTPARTKQRANSLAVLDSHIPTAMSFTTADEKTNVNVQFAEAVREYTRPDLPIELGAMKEFKLRNDEEQSLKRLEQEIEVLRDGRPGLPKLLGANLNERWMVTEYFSNGTLEDHLLEYRGNPALALKAFRSVVNTVAQLHKEGIVHRDIKPANIFIGRDHELILGDFGLVFVPDRPPRITAYEGETVGAGDFIPPPTWRGMGVRPENVNTSFDVYMLGKVLWCMVAGKPKLDREYWEEPGNDLTKLFRSDPHTYMINVILGHSVVERQERSFGSAVDLLLVVDTNLESIKQGGQLLNDGIPRICHVCGVGRCTRQILSKDPNYNFKLWNSGAALDISTFGVEMFECGTCHHIQFFRANPRA
jgi:serine/threonine protein kinase